MLPAFVGRQTPSDNSLGTVFPVLRPLRQEMRIDC